MSISSRTTPIAVTMGEPAGIGPELTVKAWFSKKSRTLGTWFYVGDASLLYSAAKQLGATLSIRECEDFEAVLACPDDCLPVLMEPLEHPVEPGVPSTHTAAATLASIERAANLALQGGAGGVVTNPIQKSTLYDAGFKHPGHTEYLAAIAGKGERSVMMLVAEDLRTVPVTVHVPLAKVPSLLSIDLIVETVRIVHRDMIGRFGISAPRIAIAGLNPHAGEAGALGHEEQDVIAPAIAELRGMGIDVTDPLPADTMFHAAARKRYDVAVCMYHDQALIPVKTIGFDTGVNCTLGLPFIRTSPDHGTALDIAGKGLADPSSLIAAITLAQELSLAETARAA